MGSKGKQPPLPGKTSGEPKDAVDKVNQADDGGVERMSMQEQSR
jgi:polar amino acid transport system permease protein